VLVTVLVIVVWPLVARPIIVSLVRDALPFDGDSVAVGVDVGPALLAGEIETVAISGRDLQAGGATIGLLQLDFTAVAIADRSFRDVDGRLEDVAARLEDGNVVSIARIVLSGPSTGVKATTTLDAPATEGLVRSTLAERGIVPQRVSLLDGAVEVTVQGIAARAAIEVRGGSLFLVPGAGLAAIAVIERDGDAAWAIDGATVSPAGLVIEATVDAAALLTS
jgi:hypothetical protein